MPQPAGVEFGPSEKSQSAGVDLILQKPVSPMEFGLQIERLLAGGRNIKSTPVSTTTEISPAIRQEVTDQLAPQQLLSPTRGTAGEQPQYTLLIVDPDEAARTHLEELADQFCIDTHAAPTLAEARRLARTPMLTGVLLSTRAIGDEHSLREAVELLRTESPLRTLPVAILDAEEHQSRRVDGLWAGASIVTSKPLTPHLFGQVVRRLIALCRDQKSTILVIEARTRLAEKLVQELNRTTTTVHYANSAQALFEHLEQYRPDLLLLDAHPGGISAFDICRTLRAMPRWQDLPIVLVDDEDDQATRLAAYEAGADDFISRRIDGAELRARIHVRLERARLLKERADYDLLTGLMTRRAFAEQLAMRLSEAQRHQRPLAMCLLDVDHFKRVNDAYGHPAGDQVLESLGQLLRHCFRVEDLRARWGGEEFAVVLIDEGVDTAKKALNRLRQEFSNIEFQDGKGNSFSVTFSAGIAEYPADGENAEDLISAADDRLLMAKRSGRNKIVGTG